jgi:hypothetical protein
METRRRLRPVVSPLVRLFSRLAPYITSSLLFVVQLIAALIALIMELGLVALRRLAALMGVGWLATTGFARRHVTPRGTVAAVGAFAAVLLGISQFADYHGVAVDAPAYAGEVGRVAPAPIIGTESAGSAHLWVLLPVAAAALLLVLGAYRGNLRLAAGVVMCGAIGLAVAIAVDLPQGVETGREGLAFYGAEAELLGGFWVEVTASATLILCGCLLPLYSCGTTRRARRRRGARARTSHPEVGGIEPGLQAGS